MGVFEGIRIRLSLDLLDCNLCWYYDCMTIQICWASCERGRNKLMLGTPLYLIRLAFSVNCVTSGWTGQSGAYCWLALGVMSYFPINNMLILHWSLNQFPLNSSDKNKVNLLWRNDRFKQWFFTHSITTHFWQVKGSQIHWSNLGRYILYSCIFPEKVYGR